MPMLTLQQHIELRGENPLQAVIVGTEIKASLVANLYIQSDANIDTVCTQYDLTPAQVYAALAFYYDNRERIKAAFVAANQQAQQIGTPVDDKLDALRRRL
jgi:uncharacterized protein (DUF433 family)